MIFDGSMGFFSSSFCVTHENRDEFITLGKGISRKK